MRIEHDIKLDYKDVLFKPKRSTLTSRRDVDLTREFKFYNSGKTWKGIPIMAANMDGVGTFAMAKVLQEKKMITVMRKHYSVDDWKEAIGNGVKMKYLAVCTGTGVIWDPDAKDYNTMKSVLEMYPDIPFICVDVAKAFGAGAHFVMLGGMLAGHDESEGEIVEGTVQFYGMSSNAAMAKHGSRKDGYRGAEGKVVKIPYKGAVEGTLTEILGGVRSAATYIGAKRIKDMPKCTTFVRCTQNVNPVFNQFNA